MNSRTNCDRQLLIMNSTCSLQAGRDKGTDEGGVCGQGYKVYKCFTALSVHQAASHLQIK